LSEYSLRMEGLRVAGAAGSKQPGLAKDIASAVESELRKSAELRPAAPGIGEAVALAVLQALRDSSYGRD
jgi:hypothetical protein